MEPIVPPTLVLVQLVNFLPAPIPPLPKILRARILLVGCEIAICGGTIERRFTELTGFIGTAGAHLASCLSAPRVPRPLWRS